MKERLVGAAVLVAIGVWLIPWVLDGPETPLDTGASSLQLPAAEEPVPMRTQTLRLGADAESELELPAPATPEPTPAAAAAEPSVDPAEEAPVASAVETTVAAADPVAARAPEPRPAAPTAVTPPKPASPPAPAAAAKGDWVVQLGSFGEEANARRQAQLASTYGYKAAVSSIRSNGRTLYRVRVGPLATRGAADAAASALAGHGVRPATVVAAD